MTYKQLCRQIDEAHEANDKERLFWLVFQLAMKRLYNEDAAQDATVRTFERLSDYKGRSEFHRWVNSIVTSRRPMAIAAEVHQREQVEVPENPSMDEEHEISISFPNETTERVFELKAEGYDLREIAKLVGIDYGALRKRCERWRKEIVVEG